MAAPSVDEFVLGSEPLQPGEVPLAQARPSPLLLVVELLRAVGVVALALIPEILQFIPDRGDDGDIAILAGFQFFTVVVGFMILFGGRVLKALVQVLFTTYTFTNDRVYVRSQFISVHLNVVPFEKISTIQIKRGLLDRLMGLSTIHLRAYGTDQGHLRLRGFVDPLPVFRLSQEGLRRHHGAEAIMRSD